MTIFAYDMNIAERQLPPLPTVSAKGNKNACQVMLNALCKIVNTYDLETQVLPVLCLVAKALACIEIFGFHPGLDDLARGRQNRLLQTGYSSGGQFELLQRQLRVDQKYQMLEIAQSHRNFPLHFGSG